MLDPAALRDHQTGQPLLACRVQRVHLGHLSERARVERSLALLLGMAFDFAAAELRGLAERSLVDGRRARARAVERLARAWAQWDRAQFGEAHRLITEANRALREAGMAGVREAIDGQRAALAVIVGALDARRVSRSGTSEALAVLGDAYAAILRRATTGDAIGVAAWARVLLESVLDYCLAQAGLSPRGVTAAELAKLGRSSARARAAVEVAAEAAKLPASGRKPIDLHALPIDTRRTLVIELFRAGAIAGIEGRQVPSFEKATEEIADATVQPSTPRAAKSLVAAATDVLAVVRTGEGARLDPQTIPLGTHSLLAAVEAIEREL